MAKGRESALAYLLKRRGRQGDHELLLSTLPNESPEGGGCSLGSVFMLIDASIGINEPRTYRASNCISVRRQMQSATEFSNVTYDSATVGKEGTFQGLWGRGECTCVAPATDPNRIHMAAHHGVKH